MTADVRAFRRIADAYLEETNQLFPHEASALGLAEFNSEIGRNDAGTHLRHRKLLVSAIEEIEDLPDTAFHGDDWLDRRGLLALLRTALFFNQRERWRIDPQMHSDAAIDSVFNLAIRYSDRLPLILPAIESRLARLPYFLEAGAACVRRPVPLWTKLAGKACAGAEKFLVEFGAQLMPLSATPEKFAQLLAGAVGAFRAFAAETARKPAGPANGYAVGREGFEFLVRERTGLQYTARELNALGARLVAKTKLDIDREARRFGRRTSAQILDEAAERWTPRGGSVLEEYQAATGEISRRFQKAGLVTFPKGERCKVLPVPPFMRHQFPTAAYHSPAPFDRDQTGIFWVNDLSGGVRDAKKAAAEIRQHFGMEFTCAHEAYPGHHLQHVIQNKHRSKFRRLFHHAIYYEGWTLWCEKMAVDERVIDFPEARLIQLHDALWRAHRIGIDSSLHDGTLTFAGACKRLRDGAGFTAARAEGDVNWYTSSPTVPMSYLLGRLEVERLHERFVRDSGWTLRCFNDWMLSFGAIPWSWIVKSESRRLP